MSLAPLPSLLNHITSVLNRGPAVAWTDYDFEQLSDEIFVKTGTRLSITTLKRVWGRIQYRSRPSTTTLNALAQFAGYTDWRGYEQEEGENEHVGTGPYTKESGPPALENRRQAGRENIEEEGAAAYADASGPPALTSKKKQGARTTLRWFLVVGGILLLVALALLLKLTTAPAAPPSALMIDPADYTFSSRKVKTEGVPNTVVFNYTATAAGDLPVRISQSWDTARSVKVSAQDSVHSSQYFYPGYFNAKLLVGQQTVRSHDLYITAPDWVGAVHRSGIPIYLDAAHFREEDTLVVSEQTLSNYNLALEPDLPELRFYRVPEMPEVRTDNFDFTTHLRSDYHGGSGACQAIAVFLLCKNDVIVVPLRAEGCTGETGLFALGTQISSKNADLSGFGSDLSQWTSLHIKGRDQQVRFFVNDRPALTTTVEADPKEIIGVSIRMLGPGRIGETILAGDGIVVRM